MMKMIFRKRYFQKKRKKLTDNDLKKAVSSESPTVADDSETSPADTIRDDLIGEEVSYKRKNENEEWDLRLNKQSMTTEDRWSNQHMQTVTQLWDLSDQEQTKLLELKYRVADIDHWKNDPYETVRFLKEVQGNVKKAEDLFRSDHKWRMENKVDDVLEDYQISPIRNFFPVATLKGVDHEGDPIHLERPGAVDAWAFYNRLGADQVYDMTVYLRELDTRGPWQKRYEERHGHPVKQFTMVFDLAGLNRNHMRARMLPLLGRVLVMAQTQYPFIAKRILVLRAPRIFKILWSIIEPFLQENIKKLIVFSTQKDYLDVIDEHMDRSVLPSCVCEEGRGEGTLGFEYVRFEGSELPPEDMTDEEIQTLLELLKEKDRQREQVTTPSPINMHQMHQAEYGHIPIQVIANTSARSIETNGVAVTLMAAGCY